MTEKKQICTQCKWEIPKGAKKCMHCGTNLALEKNKKGCMFGCLTIMAVGILAAMINSLSNSWGSKSISYNDSQYLPAHTSVENIEMAIKNSENKEKIDAIEGIVKEIWNFEVSTWDWNDFATNKTKQVEVIVNADANSCLEARDIVYAIMRGVYSSKNKNSIARIKVNIPYYIKVSLWANNAELQRKDISSSDLFTTIQGFWTEEKEKWSLKKNDFRCRYWIL